MYDSFEQPSSITALTVSEISVRWLSQDNRIKQRRVWLLLGWVTAERSCPCKRPACPAISGGSEVTFKPLVPRLSFIIRNFARYKTFCDFF
ncbi:hypothetical protein J6590_006597 [Homalodisca vitripennis]|nr:hypothetical protein J6590_006597 [Homalodisca vitripennis]